MNIPQINNIFYNKQFNFKQKLNTFCYLKNLNQDTFTFTGGIKFTPEEKQEFEKAVGELLKEAYKNSQTISIAYLSKKIGVSRGIITEIINSNEEYQKLYEQVRKCSDIKHKTSDEIKTEESKIEKRFILAINEDKKVSIKQLAKELKIPESTIRDRISNNEYLSKLYENVKLPKSKPTKEDSLKKEKEIEELLRWYVENNQKIKTADFVKQIKVATSTFYEILSRNEKINSLWQIVKKQEYNRYSQDELTTLDNFIHRFLLQKREKQETATLNEIAQYFDISKALVSKRILQNPSLKYQWDKVKSQSVSHFDETLKNEQRKEIIRILKEFDKLGEKITKEKLSQLTGLSSGTIQNRIQESTTATALWNKVKSQNYTHYSERCDSLFIKQKSNTVNKYCFKNDRHANRLRKKKNKRK